MMKKNKILIAVGLIFVLSFNTYGFLGITIPVIDVSRIFSYSTLFKSVLKQVQKYAGLFDGLSEIDKEYYETFAKVTKAPGEEFVKDINPEDAAEIRKKVISAEYFKGLSSEVWNKIADKGTLPDIGTEEDYNRFNELEYYKKNTEYQKRMNETGVKNTERYLKDVNEKLALIKNQRQLLEKFETKHEEIKAKLEDATNGLGQQEEGVMYSLNVLMIHEEVLQLQDVYSLIRSMLESEINERMTILNSRNYLKAKQVEDIQK
jgi:hypothetical protein